MWERPVHSAANLGLAVVPWSDRSVVARLTPDVLPEVHPTHPTATIEGLAIFVSIVVRRPA
jgi:hypothetical protein